MAPKHKKPSPSGTSKPKVKEAGLQHNWLGSVLYGLLGACAFYFVNPILNFALPGADSFVAVMSLLCGALAFSASTPFFQKYSLLAAKWSIPVVLLQIVANVLLTYAFADQNGTLLFLANILTIPLAILWFFILKKASGDTSTPQENGLFSLRETFSKPAAKIGGIIILAIAAVLFFYRLGYYDIWEDENLVINAAKGFHENGFSYFDEGYDRAWLHTVIISGFFNVFEISEWSGRLPSAIFGLIFVLICFFVFARWYGIALMALLIPLICLMNDRFLILFRYMRMYALLIPVFLAAAYIIYNAIHHFNQKNNDLAPKRNTLKENLLYIIPALLCFPLLGHIHKLSMVILPAVGLLILYLTLQYRNKNQMRVLYFGLGAAIVLAFFTWIVQLESTRMFRQIVEQMLIPHNPFPAYFEYVFENGLPRNSTIMVLFSGLGLLLSAVPQRLKSLLVFNYLLILIATISMVYLVKGEGRDYRYVAHLVPFVVCNLLVVSYYGSQVFRRNLYPWVWTGIFLLSTILFIQDYERVYVRHPWAPRYSTVYATLQSQYKPGDALFARNIKTYYLDPVALAGEHYHKISKKSEYTKKQFLEDIRVEGHGWVMWELHKSHHWSRDILEYIYKNFKPVHSNNLDDLGVALFYYDESMIR